MTAGGCGIQLTIGGNAEANVEFLLKNVYQTVDLYLKQDYGSGLFPGSVLPKKGIKVWETLDNLRLKNIVHAIKKIAIQ